MNKLSKKIYYTLNSGKNSKFPYYLRNYTRMILPKWPYRRRLEKLVEEAYARTDIEKILQRVNYYNRLPSPEGLQRDEWLKESKRLKDQKITRQKVYFFDSFEYTRYFPQDNRWLLLPGDITFVPRLPSVTKSRPLIDNNHHSVLLNLDKIRHFIFVNDKKRFTDKKDMAIFRGKVKGKEQRQVFLKMFSNHPMFDVAAVDKDIPGWEQAKMTIGEHLDYKFIMALEGNDVASNLKWVMSSNSIAVMPRPTCETWFMEGTLIPNYHYIEIKDDFSDIVEKLNYYIAHPEEAEAIISHAHEYIEQFKDKKREKLISLLTLKKYFDKTSDL